MTARIEKHGRVVSANHTDGSPGSYAASEKDARALIAIDLDDGSTLELYLPMDEARRVFGARVVIAIELEAP